MKCMYYKRLRQIPDLLCFCFALFVSPQSLQAQQEDSDSLWPLIEGQLKKQESDTSLQFILFLVRGKCGDDYACLYQNYLTIQTKLERLFKIPAALYVCEEIVKIARREKAMEDEANAHTDEYRFYHAMGDSRMSITSLDQAGRIFEKTDNQSKLTYVKMSKLKNNLSHQDAQEVLPQLDSLLAQAEARNDQSNTIRLHILLMQERIEAGHFAEVGRHIESLESISATLTGRHKNSIEIRTTRGRAGLARGRNELEEAVRQYQKTLQILKKETDRWVEVHTLQALAEVEWEQGNHAAAKTYLDQAEQEALDPNLHERLSRNFEIKSRFAEEEGRHSDALEFLKKKLFYEQKWESHSAGFDLRRFYLQQEKEQLATEKERQALELRLKKNQVTYLILVGVLTSFLAAGLYIGFNRQRKAKKELAKQNTLIHQQAEELRNLDSAKSRFFANVSHELRTPLSLMLGPIRTLLKEKGATEKQTELLRMADRGGKNLEMLVNEILDLGKMEAGKMELVKDPVQAAPFFRNYFAQFDSLAQRNGVAYNFETDVDGVQTILLDKEKCRQIVYNLLYNAFKFTPPGDSVAVSLRIKNGQLTLEVTDTGEGIHPDDLPHVFDRYFQTKRPGATATGGTGIGLAICHEYARLFEGNISVESTPGIGTTFRVVFPVEVLPDEELPGTQEEPSAGFGLRNSPTQKLKNSKTQKPSILVVEDSPDLQAYIRMVLQNDFHVTTAGNGAEALTVLQPGSSQSSVQQSGSPQSAAVRPGKDGLKTVDYQTVDCRMVDLIISDLMMPVMDGYQLVEKLKAEEATRHLPIIMLTARADRDDRLKALRIGVDDYLTKPFDEEELKARINNLLANQSVRKSATTEMDGGADAPNLPRADEEWLENFEAFVQKHLSNDVLTIGFLSHEFAMSESTLLRQVKRLTGLSPKQYLQEVRLDAARLLLENRSYRSVSKVAEKVGYARPRSFSRSFKERFGRLPQSYLSS